MILVFYFHRDVDILNKYLNANKHDFSNKTKDLKRVTGSSVLNFEKANVEGHQLWKGERQKTLALKCFNSCFVLVRNNMQNGWNRFLNSLF